MLLTEIVQEKVGRQTMMRRNPFHAIAGVYDKMSLLISFGLIRVWRRRAARMLALRADEVALDLGTGTADFAMALLRASDPNARVIGIDLTPEMLALAQVKIDQSELAQRLEVRVGDGERINLPDDSVDLCCSAFFARTLADLERGLCEMRRVTRPGGCLACLEVSHPPGKLLRALFHSYFYRCAPLAGTLLGQRLSAYQYFPQSLRNFPDAPGLKTLMEKCGWHNVQIHYLNSGMVALHIGEKRSSPPVQNHPL